MSELKVNSIVDANSGNTTQINGMTPTADSLQGFRNRIINGDMRIDQRNAGASVTNATSTDYSVDRWNISGGVATKFTAQRSTIVPTGFTNSLLITSSSAYSIGASDYNYLMQGIEGFNVADLGWGTANAQSITLSFWVRSSLTGTFGGTIRNLISGATRAYPFTFSISSANTYEYKTITIPGDTTGIWATDNSNSLTVCFGFGAGSTFSGTAGVWAGSNLISATGAVSLVGTNGATFNITGVQLEAGSVATPFERRPYGTELALCQRYYYRSTIGGSEVYGAGHCQATTSFRLFTPFPTTMRTSPTAVEQTGTAANYTVFVTGNTTCSSVPSFGGVTEYGAQTNFTVASGLTAGNGGQARSAPGVTSFLAWSAEL